VAHVGYGEYNQRHLLERWADYLETEPTALIISSVGMPEGLS
jgi:hypothetical protein